MTITEAQCPVCRRIRNVVCKPIKWEGRDGLEIRCETCHVDVAVVFYGTKPNG